MDGHLCEPCLQLKVLPLLDSNMRVPGPVADCITGKLDRNLSYVANELPLLFEEGVPAVRGQEDKPLLKTNVLKVCEPRCFAPGPRRFAYPNTVFLDDPSIDGARIFSLRNFAGDVEEVAAADIRHRELLNEAGDACRLAAILHRHSIGTQTGVRDCLAANPSKPQSSFCRARMLTEPEARDLSTPSFGQPPFARAARFLKPFKARFQKQRFARRWLMPARVRAGTSGA